MGIYENSLKQYQGKYKAHLKNIPLITFRDFKHQTKNILLLYILRIYIHLSYAFFTLLKNATISLRKLIPISSQMLLKSFTQILPTHTHKQTFI